MPELIVLTCASGRQCSAIIPHLYSNPQYTLRLVVNSPSSRERLSKQWPDAEVIQADLHVPDECAKIVTRATTLLYIGPPFHPHEVTFGMNMIDAAVRESKTQAAPFRHFIFSSALHPELTKLVHHSQKARIEEYLTESGLPYTILQPSTFMDNFLGQLINREESSKADPTFRAPFNPDVPMSFSCLADHADVAVKIVQERDPHLYATYQLASTLPITLREYVAQVGDVLGTTFEIQPLPFEQAGKMFVALTWGQGQDVGQEFKDGPERMLLYYESRGLYGNPGVMGWLLGRRPNTPADVARLKMEETK
ncbi:hypothetical protein G647_03180 [Cladophialophora carrionii CBS 160.54]|uniref:NmrA-like domain-containing protein n=1 Tax=Cladophialophora carrionii CBS 160.54 TaxID=1279043 RepID=V9DJC1_9EURO|nr:uncharacterized protein G647_03180 [Cladophialophora carrionii CBS 160.54]ETI26403.1 hypothetical protein G647_03180 [Cladophialophora carrionii CBS 160.54]